MFNLIVRAERWKFNKDYGVWVSTEGHFKDRHKRIIAPKVRNSGYLAVKTEVGFTSAHRLVMMTWRPCVGYEILTVDHLNHNKRDNSLQNLEWVSQQENNRRAKEDELKEDLIENCYNKDKVVLALKNRVTQLEGDIKSLKGNNAHLGKTISELNLRIANQKTEITRLLNSNKG